MKPSTVSREIVAPALLVVALFFVTFFTSHFTHELRDEKIDVISPSIHNDLDVDKQLTFKTQGRVLYEIPEVMKEGEEQTIPVRISGNLIEDLKKGLPDANDAKIEPINAYSLMGVRLRGDEAFKIVPPPEEDQFVSQDKYSEWTYTVTPTASGSHPLTLLVGVRIMLPGGHEESRFMPLLERKVTVKVNVRYATLRFLTEHFEFFMGGVVFGPIGFFLKRWIGKSEKR